MKEEQRRIFEFGPFRLDPLERRLLREGEAVPLFPKALELLLVLIQRRPELLEKEELIRSIWPDSQVEEGSLARNISTLRKALGESPGEHRYIVTVPGRGYQFVAGVNESNLVVRTPTGQTKSIAVLPFKSLGLDPEDDYLGLGMADAIITRLGNVRPIEVRATSAVRKFANTGRDPVSAGHELDVEFILEGQIHRMEDRVRVTVQLVSVQRLSPIWGETFEGDLSDIFALQDRLSEHLAVALTVRLSGADRARWSRGHSRNTSAYHAYLKGRYHWEQRTEAGLRRAIQFFEQAIGEDPSYALAYAGLADSYCLLANAVSGMMPAEAMPRVRTAAVEALRLDGRLAEAHTSLGLYLFSYEWNWASSEQTFRRAIELDGAYATARHYFSLYLTAMGRHEEAIVELHRALDADPISLGINQFLGWAFYFARRYEDALNQFRKTLEIEPRFWLAHMGLGSVCEQIGEPARSLGHFKQAAALSPPGAALTALARAEGLAGNLAEMHRLVAQLKEVQSRQYLSPDYVATVFAGVQETDPAFEWLERAVDARSIGVTLLKVNPMFDPLRGDPRFPVLLRKVGLAGDQSASLPAGGFR